MLRRLPLPRLLSILNSSLSLLVVLLPSKPLLLTRLKYPWLLQWHQSLTPHTITCSHTPMLPTLLGPLSTHYPYTTYAHPYTSPLPHFGLVP